jgi:hypothetical protein
MPKTPKQFHKITFNWMIPPADRQKIEEFLRTTLGYDVDGGGTFLAERSAKICIFPKARSHKRKAAVQPAAE